MAETAVFDFRAQPECCRCVMDMSVVCKRCGHTSKFASSMRNMPPRLYP